MFTTMSGKEHCGTKRTIAAIVAVIVAGLVLAALTLSLVVTAALAAHVLLATLQ